VVRLELSRGRAHHEERVLLVRLLELERDQATRQLRVGLDEPPIALRAGRGHEADVASAELHLQLGDRLVPRGEQLVEIVDEDDHRAQLAGLFEQRGDPLGERPSRARAGDQRGRGDLHEPLAVTRERPGERGADAALSDAGGADEARRVAAVFGEHIEGALDLVLTRDDARVLRGRSLERDRGDERRDIRVELPAWLGAVRSARALAPWARRRRGAGPRRGRGRRRDRLRSARGLVPPARRPMPVRRALLLRRGPARQRGWQQRNDGGPSPRGSERRRRRARGRGRGRACRRQRRPRGQLGADDLPASGDHAHRERERGGPQAHGVDAGERERAKTQRKRRSPSSATSKCSEEASSSRSLESGEMEGCRRSVPSVDTAPRDRFGDVPRVGEGPLERVRDLLVEAAPRLEQPLLVEAAIHEQARRHPRATGHRREQVHGRRALLAPGGELARHALQGCELTLRSFGRRHGPSVVTPTRCRPTIGRLAHGAQLT
jgi:hypothetical protein